jgi:hypothetical protein
MRTSGGSPQASDTAIQTDASAPSARVRLRPATLPMAFAAVVLRVGFRPVSPRVHAVDLSWLGLLSESRRDVSHSCRVLQFRQNPQNSPNHSGDGRWPIRSRLESCGDRYLFDLQEKIQGMRKWALNHNFDVMMRKSFFWLEEVISWAGILATNS